MRTKKLGDCRKMISAADSLEQVRPYIGALVERDERLTGSRMAAYETVAQRVGVSPSWLRKLLGRQPDVKEIAHHEFFNIVAAYRALCERVEAQAEQERARAAALRREADAALASASGLVAGVAGSPRGRGAPDRKSS